MAELMINGREYKYRRACENARFTNKINVRMVR
jgi:hypothetical protein